MEGLYMIQPKESLLTGVEYYKIGKSKNVPRRLRDYGVASVPIHIELCSHGLSGEYEDSLKAQFRQKFTQLSKLGHEYYQGDPSQMVNLMKETVVEKNISMAYQNSWYEWWLTLRWWTGMMGVVWTVSCLLYLIWS